MFFLIPDSSLEVLSFFFNLVPDGHNKAAKKYIEQTKTMALHRPQSFSQTYQPKIFGASFHLLTNSFFKPLFISLKSGKQTMRTSDVSIIQRMEGTELHLSSVIETSSPWKEKSSDSFLEKIVRMENDTCAIILKDDPNKSIRFIYLSMLMSKKNYTHLQTLTNKIAQVKLSKQELPILNVPQSITRLVPNTLTSLHSALEELTKKLENHSFTHIAILKITHQFAIVDPLLITAFRTLAEDNKMSHAFDWSSGLGIGQTEALWSKISKEKDKEREGLTGRNKCVLFYPLTQLQLQFFKVRGVPILKESDCYQELSDNQNLGYKDYLMIQKVYSLL